MKVLKEIINSLFLLSVFGLPVYLAINYGIMMGFFSLICVFLFSWCIYYKDKNKEGEKHE